MAETTDRLARQITFLLEIDHLKSVIRRSYLVDGTRRENSAEHSWHLAVMAMVLSEYANTPLDALRVLKILLVHDIVEVDADDTYCYDEVGAGDKADREQRAAQRLFGLLPADQEQEMRGLWEEFEARETPEAKFAAALDRLMPLLHNYHTQGRSWRENGVLSAQVFTRNAHIADGSEALWRFAQEFLADAVAQGYLPEA